MTESQGLTRKKQRKKKKIWPFAELLNTHTHTHAHTHTHTHSLTLFCLLLGPVLPSPYDSFFPHQGSKFIQKLHLEVWVGVVFNGKDSPPMQVEERQGRLRTKLCPSWLRSGVTQWHLGQQQPRRPSWARRATEGSGEMDRSGQGGGLWAAALGSAATRPKPRSLTDSLGTLSKSIPLSGPQLPHLQDGYDNIPLEQQRLCPWE